MGKKKRKELKQWCWYCDREFEDEKVLINHQKAKHFKCDYCNKKLNTEDIKIVPNALPDRNSTDIEIFAMEGIPYDDLQKYLARDPSQPKRARVDRDPENIRAQFAAFQALQVNPAQIVSAPTPVANDSSYSMPYGYPPPIPMNIPPYPVVSKSIPTPTPVPIPVTIKPVKPVVEKPIPESGTYLIFQDNGPSMEELRADLPKYRFVA
ncbi:hypothetical protein BC833DRAFT_113581 [Globomyces pollinis-pini]|nr:hypothetical protein BC833DRAFT_113581 [Globomyces pollinis-pini]